MLKANCLVRSNGRVVGGHLIPSLASYREAGMAQLEPHGSSGTAQCVPGVKSV